MNSLSDQVIRFCDEYLVHFNATKAAKAAGYSAKTAGQQASRLLKNVKVQEYLQKKQVKVANKLEATHERTMLEIARIAFADPRKMYDDAGNLKNIKDMDDDTAAAIASVETEELFEGRGEDRQQVGLVRKVKKWSKLGALGILADHHGIKKPAPAPVNNFNLNGLSTADLKALQALKQKAKE